VAVKKPGRPRKPESERRTEVLSIHLTKAEYDALCRGTRHARADSIGNYVRGRLFQSQSNPMPDRLM
jgi:hypothetical protein